MAWYVVSETVCGSEGLLWLVKVAQPGLFPLSALKLRELPSLLARETLGKDLNAS